MKIKCDICNKSFEFPFEQNTHKHKEYELDGVPFNKWSILIDENFLNYKYKEEKRGVFKYLDLINYDLIEKTLDEGNTPLVEISKNLYIKDESVNPSGSFKDRGMPFIMNEVIKHGKNKIAIVSTGNAAISLIKYAKLYNLKSIVFVPENISESKKNKIKDASEIVYSKDIIESFENFIKFCDEQDDVFNGFLSTNISYLIGLETTFLEIYSQLQECPDYVIVPCASGGNVLSSYNAFKRLYLLGKIKKMPIIYMVQIQGGDPIKQGFELKSFDKPFIIENPSKSNTIISTDTCFNYYKIIEGMMEKVIVPVSIDDNEINNISKKYKKYNLDYTSLSVFAVYEKYIEIFKNNKTVMIATAKGE